MNIKAIIKIIGVLLCIFSLTMVPPMLVVEIYRDSSIYPYLIGFIASLVTGLALWLPLANHYAELKIRDGFLIVLLFWVVLSFFAAIPFVLATQPHLSFLNASFESVSGFTTTGATVMGNLDHLPHAILYYRQQLQLIGGMGIIVLAVAILPMIGVGGMQLYRAETPGPMKDDKLTPRIMQTAKAFWSLYLGMTIICILAYWVSGLNLFEAICDGFSTVSTGGFSIHTASFAYYPHVSTKIIAMVFMVLSGTNFALHYSAIMKRQPLSYFRDPEWIAYIGIILTVSCLVCAILIIHNYYNHISEAILNSFFNSISMITTTGLTTDSYTQWPSFAPFLIIMVAIIGACGGSTTGGIKIIRVLLLKKQVSREMKKLLHPDAVYPIKLGNRVLSPQLIESIWAFVAAYMAIFAIITMIFMATGLDFQSAFGTTVASLSNVGVGLGSDAYDFNNLTAFAKCVMMIGMVGGRLEVFTVLVIFSGAFWRR